MHQKRISQPRREIAGLKEEPDQVGGIPRDLDHLSTGQINAGLRTGDIFLFLPPPPPLFLSLYSSLSPYALYLLL